MITITEDKLVLSIEHGSPQELQTELIKSIAAAMRWKASSTNTYTNDDENQYVLAQLLEELVALKD